MSTPQSHGPVDAGDAMLRVISFDADGGAPAALRRLAAVLEAEGCALHNVWLGAPIDTREQLVFVTLRPLDPALVPAVVVPDPPSAACRHEWDTSYVLESNPPQLRCRLCGALSGSLDELLMGAR